MTIRREGETRKSGRGGTETTVIAREEGDIAQGVVHRSEIVVTNIETVQGLAKGGKMAAESVRSAGTDHEAVSIEAVRSASSPEKSVGQTRGALDRDRIRRTAAGATREVDHRTRLNEEETEDNQMFLSVHFMTSKQSYESLVPKACIKIKF
jgi:hypothetical protein